MSHPARLGRYEILSPLGQGAMGAVYKASDPVLDRVVAIKTISPLLLAGGELRDEYLERFRREAKAAGRLSHPNIVSVFDLGLDDATATPFIVMEYVPGVSLETVLRENPTLPLVQAMEIVEQVGSALEEAHRNGIVHRDIKPANVFLNERGRVKVGDFGVARLEGSELTQAGVRVGTPGYTAPEVLQGAVADARADVFALGVLAYRVFTGKRPFSGTLPEALAIDILQREPTPPAAVRPEVPAKLSAAVMRALAKSPEARTPSAQAFLRDLRASADGAGATPTPGTQATAAVAPAPEPTRTNLEPPPAARGRRIGRVAALVLAAIVLGLGALMAVRAWLDRDDASASAPPPTAPVATAAPPARTPAKAAPRGPSQPGGGTQAGEGQTDLDRVLDKAKAAAEDLLRNTPPKEETKGRGQDKKGGGKHGKKDRKGG